MSNRLPVLAAEIRCAHADVQAAAKTAAECAIAAGKALIEAKQLVKHGEWLPWLRENCALAERTAQLYMKIAEKGTDPRVIAAIGLQAAAQAMTLYYDPFDGCTETAKCEFYLFALFLVREFGAYPEGAFQHVEWIARGGCPNVEDWLTGTAAKLARTWGPGVPESTVTAWRTFREANALLTPEEIDRQLQEINDRVGPIPTSPMAKRRRKRKSATVADLEAAP